MGNGLQISTFQVKELQASLLYLLHMNSHLCTNIGISEFKIASLKKSLKIGVTTFSHCLISAREVLTAKLFFLDPASHYSASLSSLHCFSQNQGNQGCRQESPL